MDCPNVEMKPDGISTGYSFESTQHESFDSKAALYASHARFPAYQDLFEREENSYMFIFHLTKDLRNSNLGLWLPRAGVQQAPYKEPVLLDNVGYMTSILESILYPKIDLWAGNTPFLQRLEAPTLSELERIASR